MQLFIHTAWFTSAKFLFNKTRQTQLTEKACLCLFEFDYPTVNIGEKLQKIIILNIEWKMPNKCLVPGCGASYRKNPSLNFFSFVRNEERKMLWIAAIEKNTSVILDRHSIDIVSILIQITSI